MLSTELKYWYTRSLEAIYFWLGAVKSPLVSMVLMLKWNERSAVERRAQNRTSLGINRRVHVWPPTVTSLHLGGKLNAYFQPMLV